MRSTPYQSQCIRSCIACALTLMLLFSHRVSSEARERPSEGSGVRKDRTAQTSEQSPPRKRGTITKSTVVSKRTGNTCKGQVCPSASVQSGTIRVSVYMKLRYTDYGNQETVRGNVVGTTTAPAKDVPRMEIGGVLLKARRCNEIFDGDNLGGGNITVSGVQTGDRGFTRRYWGASDCWNQIGHNYFRIKHPNGVVWDSYVTGDNTRQI